jgi:predicted HTH transcriptional regulator
VEEAEDLSLRAVGLKDIYKIEKDFWNQINNKQVVSVNLLTERMVHAECVDGKDILVIEVPRAERMLKPVYKGLNPKSGTYRRNGEGDYLCSVEEMAAMYRDASSSTVDMKVLTQMDFSVFCKETVRSYRQMFKTTHPSHIWCDLDDELFLRRLGAIGLGEDGALHPTAAGLLMFGYEYEILREFPQYFLDYQENRQMATTRWTDRIVSSSGDWSGNVFDFIYRVVPRLCDSLKVPFVMKGMQRVDDTPLHKLLREAITNTCVHADFYGRRGLVIQKMQDKFVFANPGGLRLSCSEAIGGGVSDPRNGVMLKMLSMIEYGERAGSGLNGIFHVWRHVYKCSPILEEMGGVDRTILTLDTHGQQPDIDAMIKLYGCDGLSVKSDGLTAKSDGIKPYSFTNDGDDPSMVKEEHVYHYRTSVSQNRQTDFPELPLKERNLMNVLVKLGASQVSVIASEMGLGISQTKCYLQKLISKGYVCAQGSTRDRTYMYVKDVRY